MIHDHISVAISIKMRVKVFSQLVVWSMKCQTCQQSTTQWYSVYYHRRLKKPENIHIWEAGTREFGHFSRKNDNELIIKIVGD